MSTDTATPKGRPPVLGDHKKVGAKFIPPLLARLNFTELSYVRDLLPEISWIALVNRRLGYRDGARFCATLAETAKRNRRSEAFINFAMQTPYDQLEDDEVAALLDELSSSGWLRTLQEVVEPLVGLFPQCPMRFAGVPSVQRERSNLVEELRDCVSELLDRLSLPAAAAQATVLYVRGITGGLFYGPNVEPPDLNAIVDAPGTDAADRAHAHVRAAVLQEVMITDEDPPREWPRHFWNEALRLDPCQFDRPADDE